jgi:hypothetical protein
MSSAFLRKSGKNFSVCGVENENIPASRFTPPMLIMSGERMMALHGGAFHHPILRASKMKKDGKIMDDIQNCFCKVKLFFGKFCLLVKPRGVNFSRGDQFRQNAGF